MFLNKFPYSDNQQLNLDWVIEQIRYLSEAAHIKYNDDNTNLGADNVQSAIEKLKELVDLSGRSVKIIVSELPEASWTSGQTYTHIQTINDPTLNEIVTAVKNEQYIILIRPTAINVYSYFLVDKITEVPGDYLTNIYLRNISTDVQSLFKIYGLNDPNSIYAQIEADSVIKYNADQIIYDNQGSGLSATNVQAAIDELKTDIPTEALEINYDNQTSGMSATNVQEGLDELSNEKCDEALIAPVENESVSSQAYAVGKYFVRNGKLCRCLSAISIGEAFTLNTNYEETDIDRELAGTPVTITNYSGGTIVCRRFGKMLCISGEISNITLAAWDTMTLADLPSDITAELETNNYIPVTTLDNANTSLRIDLGTGGSMILRNWSNTSVSAIQITFSGVCF